VTLAALALALGAALLHAGWNLRLHASGDRAAAIGVSGLAAGAALLPAAILDPPSAAWPLVALSGAAEAAYALLLVAAYERGELSFTYPIARGTAPLLVTAGGWLVLTQRPSPLALLGAALLAAGLALLAQAGRRRGRDTAVLLAFATGLTIAAYSVIDARAVREVSPAGYLGLALAVEGVLVCLIRRVDVARMRRAIRPGLEIAAGSLGAYLLVLYAFQRADAGRVATLRELSVVIALALAAERPGRRGWTGAVLCVAGAALAAS
jgi:drug/metabolite transporter (DMT)-like permease